MIKKGEHYAIDSWGLVLHEGRPLQLSAGIAEPVSIEECKFAADSRGRV
jgi:hypothetical protein